MATIRKLLIANRGEIACRIARTCHQLGIQTVAVYSSADERALHVETAGEAVHIGPAPAAESYLNIEAILAAAQRTGAQAIHPGYGFLAENAAFARAVIDAGLIWIGPPPDAIDAMGKKRESKLMLKDVPLVPGYEGDDQSDKAFTSAAKDIGFPLMVKASAGGGGKGMRRVEAAAELPDALAAARREAKQAFGDNTLILEKFVTDPRHIEIQIIGDTHGTVLALGERECSIQRRHQKIIEETPSTIVDDDLRARMSATAVSIGQQLAYTGAGTVEFLVDANRDYYFMEMNTRLQVEHPVTELVWGGIDLVAWQIRVAEGDPLPAEPITPSGHVIEVRVYAEDPAREFLPATGPVLYWRETDAAGIRIDSGIRTGDSITTHYDPMIAKVIAHGRTRADAIRRLDRALGQIRLLGLQNNIGFLRSTLTHPQHMAGDIDTQFLSRLPDLQEPDASVPPIALIAAALARRARPSASARLNYWRNNPNRPICHSFRHGESQIDALLAPVAANSYTAEINGTSHAVSLLSQTDVSLGVSDLTLIIDGHRQTVTVASGTDDAMWVGGNDFSLRLDWISPLPEGSREQVSSGSLRAPMPGQVTGVRVEVGQTVAQGDVLMTLEAMKMEHRIQAPHNGIVAAVHFRAGDAVQVDAVLVEVTPEDDPTN